MALDREWGRYLEADGAGWLVNAAAGAVTQPDWRPVLADLVEACRRRVGPGYRATCVRGSVACGTAIKGSSDLDLVVLIDDDAGERRPAWQADLEAKLLVDHPFVTDLEVVVLGRGALAEARRDEAAAGPITAQWRFLLALFARTLDGEDLLPGLGRFRAGPAIAYVMKHLPVDLAGFATRLAALRAAPEGPATRAARKKLSTWTVKKLLRAGAELAMLRDGRFTRDLAPCARRLAARLPEHAALADRLLERAIHPPDDDLAEVEEAVRTLGPALGKAARDAGLTLEGPGG